ncbi:putative phenylacetic acid degradation protein PaaC/phenylacetate-CoA oxygenase, PaaI subunit [Tersicoccus solisilvae]|uniref:Phenylacetic acid degradation protein PaaC/phenylacetate-CoA oxygenase, PaaI subunit n=1 Tax=Tersicoccus solisilvae TaxID=1882339 RepID=A0ABQ1NNT8_9MICC|nr:1,2-phenylacetyl-CoA epoxidase subunit PaaC [Tersicoccus solisilvae]GGC81758.1 putative phenylacetic acid degradation protein PaaC/phenylacetate-CoA oxygenase, PaaI subunit [Tersicoccus solisilvae]
MSNDSATRISVGDALTPEDIAASGATASEPVAQYALRLGDDALILAQRLGWWISRAPELEEDMALANIALDQIGHARSFLTYAGTAWGKTEDELAYFRDEEEFRAAWIVALENGDFGQTIARQLVVACYQHGLYTRLSASTDATLAAIAAKALKEVDYHRDHAAQWVLRLALGTEESRRRLEHGLSVVWPYVDELFEDDELIDQLDGVAVRPSQLRAGFDADVAAVFDEADLTVPDVQPSSTGGRRGEPHEQLGYILAEMQSLARKHPGATW